MATKYEKPIDILAKEFLDSNEIGESFTKGDFLTRFGRKYPAFKKSALEAHLVLWSANDPNRLNYNMHKADPDRDDLLFRAGPGIYRRYDPQRDPAPIRDDTAIAQSASPEQEEDSRFALEAHLRDYLAKHLETIESGLTLYNNDGINGVEYSAGGRRIDILAVDHNGDYVVIELKLGKSPDSVIGQLLYYKNWVQQEMADDEHKKVRGLIIANKVSGRLLLACKDLPGIELYEYDLSVMLRKKSQEQ